MPNSTASGIAPDAASTHMSALDVFLLPGKAVLGGLLTVFQLDWALQQPLLFAIVAGFVSWLIWIVLVKTIWFITLRLLGFA